MSVLGEKRVRGGKGGLKGTTEDGKVTYCQVKYCQNALDIRGL